MIGHAPLTSLTTFLPVAGDPAVLARVMAQDPEGWLPEGGSDGQDQRRLTLQSDSGARTVSVRLSEPWWSGNTLWRTVSWDALDAFNEGPDACTQLTALDGELGLHASPGAVSLILDVRYRPAVAAEDADRLYLEARLTAERLLVDIASELVRSAEVVEVPAVVGR